MKKTLLTILPLLLIVGCSKPINESTLLKRGELMYEANATKPFSGKVFELNDNGRIKMKGNHKNGKKDGQWTAWHTTGEKEYENTYKDGSKDGKWTTYNEDGTIKTVKEY